MTFILRSQAFCFYIHITIICHEIPQFSVCPHQVVLYEGICFACDALFIVYIPTNSHSLLYACRVLGLRGFVSPAMPSMLIC